jgi:hypothetical protein
MCHLIHSSSIGFQSSGMTSLPLQCSVRASVSKGLLVSNGRLSMYFQLFLATLNLFISGFWEVGMTLMRLVLILRKCDGRARPAFNL